MDNIKKDIIQALTECYGIVTDACRKVNVPRSTYYNWLNTDAEFKAAVEDTQEEAIDFVEGKLFEKINGVQLGKVSDGEVITYDQPPSDTAIIFYLKTKAKKRGYVEKQEHGFTDSEGKDINPVTLFQLPDNGRRTGYETKDNKTSEGLPGTGA